MTHDELQALAGAYAIGALDGDELAEFREHLPGCWECRQRVLEYEEIYAEGSLALQPLKPSPELKDKLLQRISGKGQVVAPTDGTSSGSGPVPSSGSGPAPAAPWREEGGGGSGPLVAGLLLAILAALTAGALWLRARNDAGASQREVERLQEKVRALEAQGRSLEEVEAQIRRLEGETRDRLDRMGVELTFWRDLLRQPDARVIDLAGAGPAPGAAGRVVWSRSATQVAFLARDLPALPEGMAWELWAIQGERKIPAGVFHQQGPGALVGLHAGPSAAIPDGVQAFAVTREPAAGVEAPTGEVHLLGRVD